jgi:hypothetical protein
MAADDMDLSNNNNINSNINNSNYKKNKNKADNNNIVETNNDGNINGSNTDNEKNIMTSKMVMMKSEYDDDDDYDGIMYLQKRILKGNVINRFVLFFSLSIFSFASFLVFFYIFSHYTFLNSVFALLMRICVQ